ncbi:MAG: EutN/CcmL family microcompartment protein [Candidatus Eisenbacteria bacterium]|uniref:EutN/CcmL family microcompartment protein n=1 Tax=Eiseniibacteriota bacterium TaxID=2212470 RepID=A0A9D6QQ05_UNCEI|nr:EutN/CcmL family microcompartment protein [Candidatus Eisenbacteria bacterium]MBI3540414.1 EutN/CcmL family microcompartment protein [Candidatus Eisenbacteria bacterium]
MHFARVVGTVVCTVKVPSWRGHRLLVMQPTDPQGADHGRTLVAVDLVSAAPGQRVFYVRGREAANALPDADNPADAAIVGIVDDVRILPPEGGGR